MAEVTILSMWLDPHLKWKLRSGRVKTLHVREATNAMNSLDFLQGKALTSIEHLIVTEQRIVNLSQISKMPNLQTLYLAASPNSMIKIPDQVRDFACKYTPNIDSVFSLASLNRLVLHRPPSDIFERFEKLSSLRELKLRECRQALRIKAVSNLESLAIFQAQISDSSELSLMSNLRRLEFESVTGNDMLEPLRALRNLQELVVMDCGVFSNLEPVLHLPLSFFQFGGTSRVLEIDERAKIFLLKVPELRVASWLSRLIGRESGVLKQQ